MQGVKMRRNLQRNSKEERRIDKALTKKQVVYCSTKRTIARKKQRRNYVSEASKTALQGVPLVGYYEAM
jgi:hypothetical protein